MNKASGRSVFYTVTEENERHQKVDDQSDSELETCNAFSIVNRRTGVSREYNSTPDVAQLTYNGNTSVSPPNEWSMVNNPEFSVHNFQIPDALVPETTEGNHINQLKLDALVLQERQSQTDIPCSNVRESFSGSKNWYVPSRESINEAVINQPSSLPSNINSTSNSIPAASLSNTLNGHCQENDTSKDESQSDQTDIKTSLMSFWNNMKNGKN